MTAEQSRDPQAALRLRAGVISLVVGTALLGTKYVAYLLTGSAAVFSDALESIVNVVAAVFALGSLIFAGRPADRDHPYGHGKMEYFSAAFEGGLIAFSRARSSSTPIPAGSACVLPAISPTARFGNIPSSRGRPLRSRRRASPTRRSGGRVAFRSMFRASAEPKAYAPFR